jgi:hypothetical protein
VPDNLDDISILPNMRKSGKNDRYKLIWPLDLVSDSSGSYINLVFQNINSKYFLIDTIPPELLSYCISAQLFSEGKKRELSFDLRERYPLTFTIRSTDTNTFTEAHNAFSNDDYDLSLNEKIQVYARVCQNQLCFVQHVNNIKIVIPCFVIAATYYFMSTSLREAVLSRNLSSLYHDYFFDEQNRHMKIYLKSKGNVGDAKYIARFVLDQFAKVRFNQCKDHHFADTSNKYRRLKADFPVAQELTIKARGILKRNEDGSQTYIVLNIVSEDSTYPFDSIDIYYDKEENLEEVTVNSESIPKPAMKHNKRMNNKPSSSGIVQSFLSKCDPIVNNNAAAIIEKKIQLKKKSSENDKFLKTIFDKQRAELSAQPPIPTDDLTKKGNIQEADSSDKTPAFELPLETFITMVTALKNTTNTLTLPEGNTIPITIGNLNFSKTLPVPRKRGNGKYLTRKESYNHTVETRRQYASVTFTCNEWHVCLVEIDQTGISHDDCSTRMLISKSVIDDKIAELCVENYVNGEFLSSLKVYLNKNYGIILKTKNHPHNDDEDTQKDWRERLLEIIFGNE